jgi:hypothetical protein
VKVNKQLYRYNDKFCILKCPDKLICMDIREYLIYITNYNTGVDKRRTRTADDRRRTAEDGAF